MGFRSVMMTEDSVVVWPKWFLEKYAETIQVIPRTPEGGGRLVSTHECKLYMTWAELPEDLAKALQESEEPNFRGFFDVIFLHECRGISKLQIELPTGKLKWLEPSGWFEESHPTHSYCYGCSDRETV